MKSVRRRLREVRGVAVNGTDGEQDYLFAIRVRNEINLSNFRAAAFRKK